MDVQISVKCHRNLLALQPDVHSPNAHRWRAALVKQTPQPRWTLDVLRGQLLWVIPWNWRNVKS